jgi:RNA polymerase sigma-70 factor, ECF subfamily
LVNERANGLQGNAESERLLERAKTGDNAAFAGIVREQQSLVFSIAFHFSRNSALAEEIAQDIFLHLYRNLAKIESAAHLVYWLRRSTTNRCIDQSRKLSYRIEVPLEGLSEPAAGDETRDEFLSESLRKHVSALPEWQRAVVVLRFQEDMDAADIAEMLRIPLNTVKSRLHRAMETLRERMERKHRVRV